MTFNLDKKAIAQILYNAKVTADAGRLAEKNERKYFAVQQNAGVNIPTETKPIVIETETAEAKEIAEIFSVIGNEHKEALNIGADFIVPKTWEDFLAFLDENKRKNAEEHKNEMARLEKEQNELKQLLIKIEKAEAEELARINTAKSAEKKVSEPVRKAFIAQVHNGTFSTSKKDFAEELLQYPELKDQYELKEEDGLGGTKMYSLAKKQEAKPEASAAEKKETSSTETTPEKMLGSEINAMLQKVSNEPVKINITLDADGKVEQTQDKIIQDIKSALDKTGLPYANIEVNEKGSTYLIVTKDGSKFEILKLLAMGNAPMPTYLNKAKWINHIVKTEPDAVRAWALNANKSETESTELKEESVSGHVLLMRKLLNTELEDLDLSVAAYNFLKASNIHSLGQLVQYTPEELAKLPNYTQKAFRIIEKLIADKGLAFGIDLDKYGEFEFPKKEETKLETSMVEQKEVIPVTKKEVVVLAGYEEGMPVYEHLNEAFPDLYPGIPKDVFDAVIKDMDAHAVNADFKYDFQKGEYIKLGINSSDKVLYQIMDTRGGYYFIGKVLVNKKPGEALEILFSTEPRESVNPEFIVCSQEEIIHWLNNISKKEEFQSVEIEKEQNRDDYKTIARLIRYNIEHPNAANRSDYFSYLEYYPNLMAKVEEIENHRAWSKEDIAKSAAETFHAWLKENDGANVHPELVANSEYEMIQKIDAFYDEKLKALGIDTEVKIEEPQIKVTSGQDALSLGESNTPIKNIEAAVIDASQLEINKRIKIIEIVAPLIEQLSNDKRLKLAELSGDKVNAIRKNKIAAEYAKAKIENTNFGLVKAVEDLIQGKELSIKDDTEKTPDGSGKGDIASEKTETVTPATETPAVESEQKKEIDYTKLQSVATFVGIQKKGINYVQLMTSTKTLPAELDALLKVLENAGIVKTEGDMLVVDKKYKKASAIAEKIAEMKKNT